MSAEEKAVLRKEALLARDGLDEITAGAYSRRILFALTGTDLFAVAKTLFCYYPIRKEPDLRELIGICHDCGKKAALPKTTEDGLRFFYVGRSDALIPGKYGIPEPPERELADGDENAVVVLPGAAFSAGGDRIGYGGGYYDRYLSSHAKHPKIGVCYDFQLYDVLPSDEKDVRMDMIITEKRTLRI